MKVKELIKKLESLNGEAEIYAMHYIILKNSDKVVVNQSKVNSVLAREDGAENIVILNSEGVTEDL